MDLYTDYLISNFGQATATGLAKVSANAVSHDKITRLFSSNNFTSKDLCLKVKGLVRKYEREDTKFYKEANFRFAKFSKEANFRYVKFSEGANFDNITLPNTINFLHLDLDSLKGEIDFSSAKRDSTAIAENKPCLINLMGTDVSKIKLPYINFKLWFPDSKITFAQKSNLYEQLLKKVKADGFTQSFEKLDAEYQEFRYLENGQPMLNWLLKNWWGYSYKKELVFRNTGLLFGIFFLINFLLFPVLISKMYGLKHPKEVENPDFLRQKSSHFFKRIPIVFYYTGLIFFGLKVEIERLNYTNIWALSYFFLVYTSGVICLGFIANIIIS